MHAGQLVELAAIVAAEGPALVQTCRRLPPHGLLQYWIASKCRHDRWLRTLKEVCCGEDELAAVLEEIFTGEVLARTWAAVSSAHDRRYQVEESLPVARSILTAHQEVRQRALQLLLQWPGHQSSQAQRINRLRRLSERWTDLLVGYLLGLDEVAEFAFDPQRARDFSEDLRYRNQWPAGPQLWPLVRGSLRAAFQGQQEPASPNADLNTAIAAGVLACFPAELREPSGAFGSLWLLRMANLAEDTQQLVAEALDTGL